MATRIKHLTSWASCSVPLDLVVCRSPEDQALEECWGILPTSNHVIVYTDHYYAMFSTLEYTGMVLDVPETARDKLRELIRRKVSRTRVALATHGPP